jgi:hypothetical protein
MGCFFYADIGCDVLLVTKLVILFMVFSSFVLVSSVLSGSLFWGLVLSVILSGLAFWGVFGFVRVLLLLLFSGGFVLFVFVVLLGIVMGLFVFVVFVVFNLLE